MRGRAIARNATRLSTATLVSRARRALNKILRAHSKRSEHVRLTSENAEYVLARHRGCPYNDARASRGPTTRCGIAKSIHQCQRNRAQKNYIEQRIKQPRT